MEDDETVSTGCDAAVHMQEIDFVDSQEGLLSSRGGGGGADILAPGLQWETEHCIFFLLWKSMVYQNSLITNFLQNISSAEQTHSYRVGTT